MQPRTPPPTNIALLGAPRIPAGGVGSGPGPALQCFATTRDLQIEFRSALAAPGDPATGWRISWLALGRNQRRQENVFVGVGRERGAHSDGRADLASIFVNRRNDLNRWPCVFGYCAPRSSHLYLVNAGALLLAHIDAKFNRSEIHTGTRYKRHAWSLPSVTQSQHCRWAFVSLLGQMVTRRMPGQIRTSLITNSPLTQTQI